MVSEKLKKTITNIQSQIKEGFCIAMTEET
jgi:hypothetical protein